MTFRKPPNTPTILGWSALPRRMNIRPRRPKDVSMISAMIIIYVNRPRNIKIPVSTDEAANTITAMPVVRIRPLTISPRTISILLRGVTR